MCLCRYDQRRLVSERRYGNRRFWCIKVNGEGKKSIWTDLDKELPQIWAEAKELYLVHKDDLGWFNGNDIRKQTDDQNLSFKEVDPLVSIIEDFLERPLPSNWYSYSPEDRRDYFDTKANCLHGLSPKEPSIIREKVCPGEILSECLLMPRAKQTSNDVKRVNKIMKSMEGWYEIGSSVFSGYGKCRGFRRVEKR